MDIYHVHHIIPKHSGGSNDPDNLIKLTIEEHAEAHKILYEEHGKIEDYIAWKALNGSIPYAEASLIANRLLSSKHLKGKTYEEIHGLEKAKCLKAIRSADNKKRTGIKYKSMNRSISNNDVKVSCLGCKQLTSRAAFGRHLKKCFF